MIRQLFAVSAVMLGAVALSSVQAQTRRGASQWSEDSAKLSQAQFAARPERHQRYYGPTDNRVAASPALYAAANAIRDRLPRGQWDEAGVAALRRHVLADGRISDDERDLIVEVTFKGPIRTITVSPAKPADGADKGYLLMSEVINDTMRASVASLLDVEPVVSAWDATWSEKQRQDALRRLARASIGSRDHARNFHALLLAEAKPRVASSTTQNAYAPLRELISQTYAVINAFPEESDKLLLRHILYDAVFDAVVDGSYANRVIMPDYLYNWIKPKPAG
ncbi:hypothetical protein CHX26_14235 [Porphyrobacter sp. HT-58-2]|uniref:hypothetical protein n=1 Tax=Porphyrobacter sp. HT-58-2 TaxID=2023229 RepID=UPI000CDC2A6D|nr:hypothetical protein [Porphyrobacter sp. HT-58-2]AUX70502.1 hypothetical protein CHX26_14235 [Porphyrobacter sp. HT-58-2]